MSDNEIKVNKHGFVKLLDVMGYDEDISTSGYCKFDNTPRFVWIDSNGDAHNLIGDIPKWSNNEIYHVSLSVDGAQFPTSFELHQNYPNPFNGSTIIPFDVHENMDISISIYDVTGKLINKLFNVPSII